MNHIPNNTRRPIFIGFALLVLGFASFMGWAAFAPLDEGVPTIGTLSVESRRKTISHLTGGIIKEILVKEAQLIDANAPVLVLDDTTARANFESVQQNWFALTATEARLLAEQTVAKDIAFPEELLASRHPLASQHMANQKGLFAARRASRKNELLVLEESAITDELQADNLEQQLSLLRQELTSLQALAAEEYAPKNQVLQIQRQAAQLAAAAQKARRSAIETKAKIALRMSSFHSEVQTEIAITRREAASTKEKLESAKEELERTIIRAPVRGYITDLSANTISGVVMPGIHLMDIVPVEEKLIFDARIPSQLIDKVHTDLTANILLHNFAESPQLAIVGRVISVSADLLTARDPNVAPYFLARVEVTDEGLRQLGKRQLLPGMQADIMIRTGERTLLTYLLKPFMRRLSAAMKEQ